MSKFRITESSIAPRVLAAYYGQGGMIPPTEPVREFHLGGTRRFVVLEQKDDVLAVYRIRPGDGGLRQVKVWPEEITLAVQSRSALEEIEVQAKTVIEGGWDRDEVNRLLKMLVALPVGIPRPSTPYVMQALAELTQKVS